MQGHASRCGGFTLPELLISIALSAIVLSGALVSLNSLTEANARVSESVEQNVGVDRALRLILKDLYYGAHVSTLGNRFTITYADGSAVAYERTPSGDELHRILGNTASEAHSTANALQIWMRSAIKRTKRGHLYDSDYRDTAVLQGVESVTWALIPALGSADVAGLKVSIEYLSSGVVRTARVSGLLLPKVSPDEADA